MADQNNDRSGDPAAPVAEAPMTDPEFREFLHGIIARAQAHLRDLDGRGPGGREPLPAGTRPALTLVSRKAA